MRWTVLGCLFVLTGCPAVAEDPSAEVVNSGMDYSPSTDPDPGDGDGGLAEPGLTQGQDLEDGGSDEVAPDGGEAPGEEDPGASGIEDPTDESGPDVETGLCHAGEERECYPFASGTAGLGQCRLGTQQCPMMELPLWGECEMAVGPEIEVCDGIDNDCDGQVDEDLGSTTCGLGPCQVTVSNCADGEEQTCEPLDVEGEEICDGVDNDCDGRTDEGLGTGMSVTCGLGACEHTVEACAPGEELACDPLEGQTPEVCDGVDNDCDGSIDEGVTNACGDCGPAPVEVCDGIDNDCDGVTDEDVTNACGTCGAVPVEVCDGVDNDCDGAIDEGVTNACGTCGAVPAEVCDGVDNDCDGAIDEGVLNACGTCGRVPTEVCDGVDNDCDGRVDEGVLNACGTCGRVPTEVCDGVDNDCDGRVDEGVLNACGGCGSVPAETCDGADNDCDGVVDEGCECEAVSTSSVAETERRPADIILIVDNSSSMGDEIGWVQDQVYAFTTDLANRQVDARLILFSARGTGRRQLCVPPPLASANCGDNPPSFYHPHENIESRDGFQDLLDDSYKWRHLLREGSDLHIVFISDDDEEWSARRMLAGWADVEPTPPDFTYHAVVAERDCRDAANVGDNHMDLANDTGGTIHDLCDQNFSAVFDGLADGIETASIACEWDLPDAPSGGALDLSQVSVEHRRGNGSVEQLPRRSSCGGSTGFVVNGASSVSLCERSCDAIQGDPDAVVTISVGCTLTH